SAKLRSQSLWIYTPFSLTYKVCRSDQLMYLSTVANHVQVRREYHSRCNCPLALYRESLLHTDSLIRYGYRQSHPFSSPDASRCLSLKYRICCLCKRRQKEAAFCWRKRKR